MKRNFIIVAGLAIIGLLSVFVFKPNMMPVFSPKPATPTPEVRDLTIPQNTNFSEINGLYQFSAQVPSHWEIEWIPEVESINIYDPSVVADITLEKSQIFIRYFEAKSFLTLLTVDILNKKVDSINGHSAMRYEIVKKKTAADFPGQPSWRNYRHKVVDIRLSEDSPSKFYVFSYNPNLSDSVFESFIQSLNFNLTE